MRFAVTLDCELNGQVRIERTYWLLSESDGGLSEEFGVHIDGRPIELESNEKRENVSERWIEAFLPHSVMRRFLVDNERLSELDSRSIDQEMVGGIDDLLGIGTLQRLNHHLTSLQRQILHSMVPEDEKLKLTNLMDLVDSFEAEIKEHKSELIANESQTIATQERIGELTEIIQQASRAKGHEDNELRIEWTRRHSELVSARKEMLEHTSTTLPFIIAGLPDNLDKWKIDEVNAALLSSAQSDENLRFLDEVLDEVSPAVGKQVRKRIEKKASEVATKTVSATVNSPLSIFNLNQLSKLERRTIELNIAERKGAYQSALEVAIERLTVFEEVEEKLRQAAEGIGITDVANEMKTKAMELGGLQVEHTRISALIQEKHNSLGQVNEQVQAIQSRADQDSFLNRKEITIQTLRKVLDDIANQERRAMAAPLAEAFHEGFSLLSRKADRLESIEIDPANYQTTISMRGFDGNWLDRDLSATEKQHVGLSLLYALRKVGKRAFPVVVDTPTSRMDREHKDWSVTKFYPALSHQVIVMATSDDLGDGLFHDLSATGALGLGLEIREVSENRIGVAEADLATFFGG
jgi:DNA sulfur modification protein DndD